MRVALVTEGTYPYSHGGVSVWCDQLVRGLDEHDFTVVALTGSGAEPVAWDLPHNVSELVTVPLWAGTPVRPSRRSRHRAGADEAVTLLVESLLDVDVDRARATFAQALHGWALHGLPGGAEQRLTSSAVVLDFLTRWSSPELAGLWGGALRRGAPAVGDAVTATRLIAHSLRPLALTPPEVDIVHPASNGVAGLPALAALWRHRTPFVLSEHGVYLRERYLSFRGTLTPWPLKWLMLRFYRLLTTVVYAEAAIVAPGNVYNRRWERQDGVPTDAIRTVYNGVDTGHFAVADSHPDEPTLVWVGRVDPLKDLETLVRGFALVAAARPAVRLRLFGGTPKGNEGYRDRIRALADELGVGSRVTFEGRVDSIRDAYAAGHVVVLTSISEGFPYTVIEAMSSGRATVSTDVGGVAEAVGSAGLVVPPRDPAALAKACLTILDNPELRVELAKRARHRVLELFTLDQSIDAFRAIYRDVIDSPALATEHLDLEGLDARDADRDAALERAAS